MKIRPRIFKSLTKSPDVVQKLKNQDLQIYFMENRYIDIYAKQGRFSMWVSDGKTYKLLILKEYYETLSELYSPEASQLWINYFVSVKQKQRKFNLIFYSIALILVIVGIVCAYAFSENMIAFGAVLGVLVISIAQNFMLRKTVSNLTDNLQRALMDKVGGEENFKEIIQKQNEFYQNYFKSHTATQEVLEELIDNTEENAQNENNAAENQEAASKDSKE